MRPSTRIAIRAACCLQLLAVAISPTGASAQDDNTGPNPADFTYDARLCFEMAELDDLGGSLITSTYELKWPLGGDVANVTGKDEGLYSGGVPKSVERA